MRVIPKKIFLINFCLFLLIITLSKSATLREQLEKLEKEESKLTKIHQGSSVTSMLVESSYGEDAELRVGCKNNFFSFLLRGKEEDFVLSYINHPIISLNKEKDLMIFSNHFRPVNGLMYKGNLRVRSVSQWIQVYEDDFYENADGWSINKISNCSGIYMLGGYCQIGGNETQKTYNNLPPHTHLKIEATYHFIDAWNGETGYMKLNNGINGTLEYAWTEKYSSFQGENGINVCGGKWPEGKFINPISVTIPHTGDSITVAFGATIQQDPCDESFGVSGMRVYVR